MPELAPFDHAVIPDRIEAGTYLIAGAVVPGSDVRILGAVLEDMEALVLKLRQAGVQVEREGEGIRVRREGPLKPVHVTTAPHPGFPTDMQAQFLVLMTQATGESVMSETIFENRFMHVAELARMGASVRENGRTAIVTGPTPLSGAQVMATDLRASASLVLAGLAASGETVVDRIYHLDRGYEHLDEKLARLGARVRRVR